MKYQSRTLICSFLFVLFAALSGARAEGWMATPHYQKDGVDMLLEGTVVSNTGQGWETYYVAVQPYFQVDTTHITAYSGMQLTSGAFDLTGGVTVYPWVWKLAKVGFAGRYNLNYYNDISLTNNFLFGGAVETRPFSWIGAKASVSALIKSRSIFAIDDTQPYLHNICQAFSVELDFYLPLDIMAYVSVASYERYRYMVAVAPSFTLGATKQFASKFYGGIEAAVRYTDFFTASAFYDSCEIRLTVGRTF